MKILVFCHEFPPVGSGAGNALSFLSKEWVRLGHAVTVFTSGWNELPASAVIDGVKVLRVPVGRQSLFRGRILEMIRYMVLSAADVSSLYQSQKPDLCVAFMAIPGGVGPLFMKRKYGVPFVTQVRGGDVPGYDEASLRWYHWMVRPLLKKIWKGEPQEFILLVGEDVNTVEMAGRLRQKWADFTARWVERYG